MKYQIKHKYLVIDEAMRGWMRRYGIRLLRISLGVVFLWFGILKFFPNLSPAEDLARETLEILVFGLIPPPVAVDILAVWECAIGLGLLWGRWLRVVLLLLWLQMLGALSPMFLFPEKVFVSIPFVPTLEGQYIIKNVVLISAAIVIGATLENPPHEKIPEVPVD